MRTLVGVAVAPAAIATAVPTRRGVPGRRLSIGRLRTIGSLPAAVLALAGLCAKRRRTPKVSAKLKQTKEFTIPTTSAGRNEAGEKECESPINACV